MQGARKYAELFKTGQYGKLYISSHYHARGRTFCIFVLPSGEVAIPNGPSSPLNKNAVEVYGITGGQPVWTETYGWLHTGKWQDDFELMVTQRLFEVNEQNSSKLLETQRLEQEKEAEKQQLLLNY